MGLVIVPLSKVGLVASTLLEHLPIEGVPIEPGPIVNAPTHPFPTFK